MHVHRVHRVRLCDWLWRQVAVFHQSPVTSVRFCSNTTPSVLTVDTTGCVQGGVCVCCVLCASRAPVRVGVCVPERSSHYFLLFPVPATFALTPPPPVSPPPFAPCPSPLAPCASLAPSRMNMMQFTKFFRWGVESKSVLDGDRLGQLVAVARLLPTWASVLSPPSSLASSFVVNTPTQGLGQVAAVGTLVAFSTREATYVMSTLPEIKVGTPPSSSTAHPCNCVFGFCCW
jgi:hypothetical protein